MKNRLNSLTISFLALSLVSSSPAVFAEPDPLGGVQDNRPSISASNVNTSNPQTLAQDPNVQFFGGGPLESVKHPAESLTPGEVSKIQEIALSLPSPVVQMGDSQSSSEGKPGFVTTVQGAVEKVQERMHGDSLSSRFFAGNYFLIPDKKSLTEEKEQEKLKNSGIPQDEENKEISSDSIIAEIPAAKIMLNMKLEVTPEVVKANEELNLSKEHPWVGLLAAKGMSDEMKEAVAKAEAQRKAIDEAAQEAAKNGKKIVFIVNKKVLSFYFNIPLFIEGDYQLLILDESTNLTPQISLD